MSSSNALQQAMERRKQEQQAANQTTQQPQTQVSSVDEKKDAGPMRAYLLPSAPCSFIRADGTRIKAADGVVRVPESETKLLEEMESAVASGTVSRFTGQVKTTSQVIPEKTEE